MAKYNNDQIIKLYNEGKTYKEIAEIIGCNPNYISLKISKLGIANRANNKDKKVAHIEKSTEKKSKQLSKKELIEQFKIETAKLSSIVRKEKEIKDNDKKNLYSTETSKPKVVEEKKEKPKRKQRTPKVKKEEIKEVQQEPQKEENIVVNVEESDRKRSYTKNGNPTMKNFEDNNEYLVDYFSKQVMDSDGNIYKVMSLSEIRHELMKDHGKK